MVIRILACILGVSFLFNVIQYSLLDSCKVRIGVQNEMVTIANLQRAAAIHERDKIAVSLADKYHRKLKAIEDKKLKEGDYSCEQSLDLIISAMKEVDNGPDNP